MCQQINFGWKMRILKIIMAFLAGIQLYSGVVLAGSAQDLLNEMEQRYESPNSQVSAPPSQNPMPPPPVSPSIGTTPPVIEPLTVPQSTQNKRSVSKGNNTKNVGRVGSVCTKNETPLIIQTNVSAKLFFNGKYLTNTPARICVKNKAIWTNDGAFLIRLSKHGYGEIVDTIIMGTKKLKKKYVLVNLD
ncbi:MAG: hypothetical protein ACYCXP_12545 [Leptospirillum sp.]